MTTPALNDDLASRLKATARDLRKNVSLASFGGEETGVRVKSPGLLLADLDEAASALEAQSKEIEALRSALAERTETIDSIYLYANDTLSGRADGGPDDRAWQRAAVIEVRNRVRKFATVESAVLARTALTGAS